MNYTVYDQLCNNYLPIFWSGIYLYAGNRVMDGTSRIVRLLDQPEGLRYPMKAMNRSNGHRRYLTALALMVAISPA